MAGLACVAFDSVQIGELFEDVAEFEMVTDTPLFEWFFISLTAEINITNRMIAAPF